MPITYKTEKDAKELWCPHARVRNITKGQYSYSTGVAGINRSESTSLVTGLPFSNESKCVESNCALWDQEEMNDPIKGTTVFTGRGRCGA